MTSRADIVLSGTVLHVTDIEGSVAKTVSIRTLANKIESVLIQGFCPLKPKDIITVICSVTPDNMYQNVIMPFVQPPADQAHIVQSMIKLLKLSYSQANKVITKLGTIHGPENLVAHLTDIAQKWIDSKNEQVLDLIPELSADKAKKLLTWWHRERGLRRLWLLGLTNTEINAARMTCEDLYNKLIQNPYTVPVIPMDKCKAILTCLGKQVPPYAEKCGTVIRVIWNNLYRNGWTGTPAYFISRQFPDLGSYFSLLCKDYGYIGDSGTVYLKYAYDIESSMVQYLVKLRSIDLLNKEEQPVAVTSDSLDESQKRAVQGALDNKLCVITGAGGTGKSTVIREIVNNLELRGIKYALCSFTGKAVARIKEVTGRSCPATIHRLIAKGKSQSTSSVEAKPEYLLSNPDLDFTHVIIDECSMVTMELVYDFIKIFPQIQQLTLIGDCNQLPPIEWGSIFSEIINSDTIPVYYLTINYRVHAVPGEVDGIIRNAEAIINHGEGPFNFVTTINFSIIDGEINRVYDILQGCYTSQVPVQTITIITPYNRYLKQLNSAFQTIYNESSQTTIDSRGVIWKVKDRVMLTENNYDIGVYNGEEGIIVEVKADSIIVDFGISGKHDFLLEPTLTANSYRYNKNRYSYNKIVNNDDDYIDEERTVKKLIHSYALTVDKAQGSEWEFVIFYIPDDITESSFLNKNRIYTAITRAKRCCWCVGNTAALYNAATRKLPFRCENLAKRLKLQLPATQAQLDKTKVVEDPLAMYDIPD